MVRRTRLFSAGLCGLVLLFGAAQALAQYRFDYWTTDNALPQNGVNSITQTPDGYLWFATNDGLVRYDGVRFTVFDQGNSKGLRSNRILSLYVDVAGTLWAGTDDGGLVRYRDGPSRHSARPPVPRFYSFPRKREEKRKNNNGRPRSHQCRLA